MTYQELIKEIKLEVKSIKRLPTSDEWDKGYALGYAQAFEDMLKIIER